MTGPWTTLTRRSAPADNPFHISQLQIILDRTDGLLDGFAQGLQDGSYDPSLPEYVGLFDHLTCTNLLAEVIPP